MVGIDSDDRLMNRDVALVMAATFCFMASNMLISPLMAGFSESLGAGGALMGVVAAMMNVVSCSAVRSPATSPTGPASAHWSASAPHSTWCPASGTRSPAARPR